MDLVEPMNEIAGCGLRNAAKRIRSPKSKVKKSLILKKVDSQTTEVRSS